MFGTWTTHLINLSFQRKQHQKLENAFTTFYQYYLGVFKWVGYLYRKDNMKLYFTDKLAEIIIND